MVHRLSQTSGKIVKEELDLLELEDIKKEHLKRGLTCEMDDTSLLIYKIIKSKGLVSSMKVNNQVASESYRVL